MGIVDWSQAATRHYGIERVKIILSSLLSRDVYLISLIFDFLNAFRQIEKHAIFNFNFINFRTRLGLNFFNTQ